MTKDELFAVLQGAYTGGGSTAEGTFAGDILRACADGMAQLWSMDIDGMERRAFVSTADGDWLTKVCADRGVERREGEDDESLRSRTLEKLSSTPASGNADHYTAWCAQEDGILRVRVLPLHRGGGTVDVVAVGLNGKCPEADILERAQAIVDENRPIGADAAVLGAEELKVDVSAVVTLMDGGTISNVRQAFEAALDEFFRDNALRTGVVSYAKALRLLLDTEGVADVTGFTLNGSDESLTLEDTQAAVTGTVTLTEAGA